MPDQRHPVCGIQRRVMNIRRTDRPLRNAEICAVPPGQQKSTSSLTLKCFFHASGVGRLTHIPKRRGCFTRVLMHSSESDAFYMSLRNVKNSFCDNGKPEYMGRSTGYISAYFCSARSCPLPIRQGGEEQRRHRVLLLDSDLHRCGYPYSLLAPPAREG